MFTRTPIRTNHGTFLAAKGPDRDLVQQEEPFEWLVSDDSVGDPETGDYLCAEEGGGTILRANRSVYGAWETINVRKVGQKQFTFRVSNGLYVRAVDDGTVLADALESGAWETFELPGAPDEEPEAAHPNPLKGRLQSNGKHFQVNGQTVLPVALHIGDMFSHAYHKGIESLCELALDPARDAGYQIVRGWFSLGNKGHNAFWKGRGFSPWMLGWDAWCETLLEVFDACAERGLQIHLAGGDMEELSYDERTELYAEIADIVQLYEREAVQIVALFEVLNECRNTGLEDPQELTRLRDIFKERNPETLTALSSYSGTEEYDELAPVTPGSQPFLYYHSTRNGTVGDCCGHAFSMKYDGAAKQLGKSLLWSGEPPGPGPRVSAISGQLQKDLLDGRALWLLAAAQTLGGVYTMFCSDGVILDGPIDHWAGFYEIPPMVQELERFAPDIHAAQLTHVGDGGPFAHLRVVDLPNNDPHVRADQYILTHQRKAVVILYRMDPYDGRERSVDLTSLMGPLNWFVLRPDAELPYDCGHRPSVTISFDYGCVLLLEW